MARSAASTIYEIIERKPEIDCASTEGEKPTMFDGDIDLKDVKFNYPSRPDVDVLKGISFHVKKGETVALVGSSGCGKSTCVQLIQRFYDPLDGGVYVDDRNVKDLNVKWLRSHIGVVGQEPALFDCSIEENIRFAKPDATDVEIQQACREANAYNFIKKLPNVGDNFVPVLKLVLYIWVFFVAGIQNECWRGRNAIVWGSKAKDSHCESLS